MIAGLVVALGVLKPADAVAPTPKMQVAAHKGELVVLTPPSGSAPAGEVTVVQPLIGMIAYAKVEGGKAQLPYFLLDARDGEDGVLVLGGHVEPRLMTPSKADVAAIDAALLRNEVLSHVKRSINGTEIGAFDVDGDGVADFAVTYGCNAWGDGSCQSRGQFFLARAGTRWVEIE
ncbi:MAG: hypothetical protein JO257_18470 [Deltaproteobacteria bacterium]|nr:hypothetical protein [Deltaproteobacteria bacterium]